MPQKCIECFRLLFDHLAWSEHQFLSVIRDSRKAGSLWGMMRGVGGVKKSVNQNWLAKRLGLGLLCLREFSKRFGRKMPALVKSAQWHFLQDITPVHNSILVTDYLTKMGIKAVPQPPYSPDVSPVTFGYSLCSEAAVIRQLRGWKRLWQRSLTRSQQEDFNGAFQRLLERYNKCIAARDYFEGDRVSCVYYQ